MGTHMMNPYSKYKMKTEDERIFEILLRYGTEHDLGIINRTIGNKEPQFRGISMYFLKPSEIIFGKRIDASYRDKLMEYCKEYPDVNLFDMTINEYNKIIIQKVKDIGNGDIIEKLLSVGVSNESLQEVAKKLGIDQDVLKLRRLIHGSTHL